LNEVKREGGGREGNARVGEGENNRSEDTDRGGRRAEEGNARVGEGEKNGYEDTPTGVEGGQRGRCKSLVKETIVAYPNKE
jgi:hypothetical protein